MNLSPAPFSDRHRLQYCPYLRLIGLIMLMQLTNSLSLSAQRLKPLLKKGEQAVAVTDYYTAIHYFQQALTIKPTPSTRFRLAEAARLFGAYELATRHYETLRRQDQATPFNTLELGLGETLLRQGEYTAATEAFERFLKAARGNAAQMQQARDGLANAKWAANQVPDSLWRITRLPRRINSPYAEFGAWKQGDTLYFSSYRFELTDDRYRPRRKLTKLLFSTDERRGRLFRKTMNSDTIHTAHTAITPDGQQLYFTRCRYTNGAQIRCQLCVKTRGRRGRWAAKYDLLPSPINLANYTSTQPSLRWDSTTQQLYLLFVSDRPGSAGAFDIWEVPIPEKGQKWATPTPLAAVNTPGNDISPYFEQQTSTLYYSSQRSPSFGGYDIYRQAYAGNGHWADTEHLPSPINSSFDDTYPHWNTDESSVYFSSTRPGGSYLDPLTKNCCPDIFKASRYEPVPPPNNETLDTLVAEVPPPPIPEPKPPTTLEEFLPLALYFDNDQPDPRTRRPTTLETYATTYFRYLNEEGQYYEAFVENEDIQDTLSTFFAKDVSGGFEDLERFSSILLTLLEENQTVEIFLKGYTSPRAKGDYNLLLGKRRVSAVRNQFLNWREGVFLPYVKSGQLIISEVSFGETRAAANVQDERAGERLSIYSVEAARERRVEIVEVRRDQ